MMKIASIIIVLFLFSSFLEHSESAQSGFTCDNSVVLTCPSGKQLLILEVIYSSKCPIVTGKSNETITNPPSSCLAYDRERISDQCNGKETCTIDHHVDQRPKFLIEKQANCDFISQSIFVEYSCIPDFQSSSLPRIDICSSQSLDELTEGFIHSPNYPDVYPADLSCSKLLPAPDLNHRLKIFAIELDLIGEMKRPTDWLEINEDQNKFRSIDKPFAMLFNDVIEASIFFKSSTNNNKSSNRKFLLYFIVVPVRRFRPAISTSTSLEPIEEILFKDSPLPLISEKRQQQNPVVMTLLVVVLTAILVISLCAFLLYKRRNDRRVRYFVNTFHSFFPHRSESSSNVQPSKSVTDDEEDLEKFLRVFPEKTAEHSFDDEHIYSADPLENDEKFQEINETKSANEVIYETIDKTYSSIYAIPKNH